MADNITIHKGPTTLELLNIAHVTSGIMCISNHDVEEIKNMLRFAYNHMVKIGLDDDMKARDIQSENDLFYQYKFHTHNDTPEKNFQQSCSFEKMIKDANMLLDYLSEDLDYIKSYVENGLIYWDDKIASFRASFECSSDHFLAVSAAAGVVPLYASLNKYAVNMLIEDHTAFSVYDLNELYNDVQLH